MVKLVAESGSTHRGSVALAKTCVDGAKAGGADFVKFILSSPDELIADRSLLYEGKSLYDTIKSYQMTDDEWRDVAAYCKARELPFFFSVGTPGYVPLAVELGSAYLKAGGWDTRAFPLFDAFLETDLPIMIDLCAVITAEAQTVIDYIRERDPEREIILMHESHDAHNQKLRTIPYLKERFGLPVGYSSEGRAFNPDYWTLAAGAEWLEKRIRPDDEAGHHVEKALNPKEWRTWALAMRGMDKVLGQYGLMPSAKDVAAKQLYFTSLHFARAMKKGEVVREKDLVAMRPGSGLSPIYSYLFIDETLARDVDAHEMVTYETMEGLT